MLTKIILSVVILIWQIMCWLYEHITRKNKKYDTNYAIFLVIVFVIYQIVLWVVLKWFFENKFQFGFGHFLW